MNFKLTKPWEKGDPRPWRKLPFWKWRIVRYGWRFRLTKSRPVTDKEFRQVILEQKLKPPIHFNCRCCLSNLDGAPGAARTHNQRDA